MLEYQWTDLKASRPGPTIVATASYRVEHRLHPDFHPELAGRESWCSGVMQRFLIANDEAQIRAYMTEWMSHPQWNGENHRVCGELIIQYWASPLEAGYWLADRTYVRPFDSSWKDIRRKPKEEAEGQATGDAHHPTEE